MGARRRPRARRRGFVFGERRSARSSAQPRCHARTLRKAICSAKVRTTLRRRGSGSSARPSGRAGAGGEMGGRTIEARPLLERLSAPAFRKHVHVILLITGRGSVQARFEFPMSSLEPAGRHVRAADKNFIPFYLIMERSLKDLGPFRADEFPFGRSGPFSRPTSAAGAICTEQKYSVTDNRLGETCEYVAGAARACGDGGSNDLASDRARDENCDYAIKIPEIIPTIK
ncbi:hypothetical protein EVAR_9288_1 [Eumeta japonica]|uniref:Uncharacterized protein n=1 Tax=Eumeta variegata TaxID=151549 RepID=A0A4C1TNK0_EUMVA|nr:hypothetical protein EVAR_9288_1 [Eumeta japonica]